MKLSEALDKYYVIPLIGSEMVGYEAASKNCPWIRVHFVVDDEEYSQTFEDQEIQLMDSPTGAFSVTDDEGEGCGFIALDGVNLKEQTS
jgi:hypothetical protein